jgi:hypothetical protein
VFIQQGGFSSYTFWLSVGGVALSSFRISGGSLIANSQFDMNSIESWETEGGALPRHTLAGTSTGSAIRDASDQEAQELVSVSPPHDHPHVYINMGDQDAILCPYCATRYRYDPRLAPFEADPQDSLFVDPNGV